MERWASFSGSIQLMPQVVKSLRTRQVRDLSLGLGAIAGLSALTWLIYGIHLQNIHVILVNALNLSAATILFVLKLRGNTGQQA